MLGQIRKVSLSGEGHDGSVEEQPFLDEDERLVTDELLLAAAEIDYQEDVIRQREVGINNIQKDVTKINELFQDVALHVTRQGEALDNIEANVTSARDRTSQAAEQLVVANRRAPSTRKNLMCMMLIVLVFIVFIGILKLAAKVSGVAPETINDIRISQL